MGKKRGRPPKPKPATPPPATPAVLPKLMHDEETAKPDRQTLAMVRRAINSGWPIDDRIRQLVVNQMALVVGKAESPRDKAAAAKVLVAADNINTKRAELELKLHVVENPHQGNSSNVTVTVTVEASEQRSRLAAIAQRLGVTTVDQPVQPPTADGDPRSIDGTFVSGPER